MSNISGGLWDKTSKNGNKYLGGSVQIGENDYWMAAFYNASQDQYSLNLTNKDDRDKKYVATLKARTSSNGNAYHGGVCVIEDDSYYASLFINSNPRHAKSPQANVLFRKFEDANNESEASSENEPVKIDTEKYEEQHVNIDLEDF